MATCFSFKISPLNVQSVVDGTRFNDMYNWMRTNCIDVLLIQDSRIIGNDARTLEIRYPLISINTNCTDLKAGLSILINKTKISWFCWPTSYPLPSPTTPKAARIRHPPYRKPEFSTRYVILLCSHTFRVQKTSNWTVTSTQPAMGAWCGRIPSTGSSHSVRMSSPPEGRLPSAWRTIPVHIGWYVGGGNRNRCEDRQRRRPVCKDTLQCRSS